MEIKAILNKPYIEEQRVDFIIEQNHNKGYEIRETETALEAWGYTEEELLISAKETKNNENITKAKQAIENGYVIFKDAQFETNAQTVGDLTATMLMMSSSELESYNWLSKDDKVIELTLEDFGILGGLIAEFKNHTWSHEYMEYKLRIEQAETLEEVEVIEIEYDVNEILNCMINDKMEKENG